MSTQTISVVFSKIADLHRALGLPNLKTLGLWDYRLDGSWQFVVNGTTTDQEVAPDGTMGWTVQPFHAVIFYNGWAAGEVSPRGGWLAAGAGANEETLIAALELAIETVTRC